MKDETRNHAGRPSKQLSEELLQRRRQALLKATYDQIAEKGLEGLRTRDIAERAGVNISTLHYYFKTKEDLLAATVEYTCAIFVEGTQEQAPPESLLRHLERAWQSFQDHPNLSIVLQELALRAQREPKSKEALRKIHYYWNLKVEGLLHHGIQAGQLRADLDPVAGAKIITSFIMGAAMQLGLSPQAFSFTEVSQKLSAYLLPPSPSDQIDQVLTKPSI